MEVLLSSLNIDRAELFQNLFCHVNTGICLFDLDLKITFVNPLFAELIGADIKELIGKRFDCTMISEDQSGCKSKLEKLLNYKAAPVRMDREFVIDSGKTVYGILETKCLFDKQQKPVSYLSSFVDISQRKISEHEILIQNRNYKIISDFSYKLASFPHHQRIVDFMLEQIRMITGAVICGFADFYEEPEGMYLEIKQRNYSDEKIEKSAEIFYEMIRMNRIKINKKDLKKFLKENVLHSSNIEEISFGAFPDISQRDINEKLSICDYYSIALTEPLTEKLLGIIVLGFVDKENLPSMDFLNSITNIASNIVNKRKSEKKLIEREQLFQKVINSSSDGIIVVDRDSIHQVWNKGAERVFARPSEEVIGNKNFMRDWKVFCSDGSEYAEEEAPLQRVFRTGKPVEEEIVRIINRKNESYWLKLNMQPVLPLSGKAFNQVVITFSEISQLKELERELKDTLDKEETLYHELRHRIKNTLSMIISIIELELMDQDPDMSADALSAVKSRVETFSGLYSMFDFSESNPDNVRMDNFLSEIFISIQKAFKMGNYDIEYVNSLDPVSLPSEEAANWGLILNELLTNAYKYAFIRGGTYRIEIDFKANSDGLQLSVANNGKRLPKSFRLDNAHGLGLRLINVLIKQLHGEFSFNSTDEKTVFTVTVKTAD